MHQRKGFTLIELLIVIAIIAILSIVVVLSLSPAETLRQSRDSFRSSDMDTLTHALNLFQEDQSVVSGPGSLGSSTLLYVSLPDSSSTCGSWNLPSPPAGYAYQCAPPSSYRNTNGSGWIPVNLASVTTGNPLGQLPVDPINTSSSGLYYTYATNGTQYEVTSLFESSKNKAQYGQNPMIPSYPEVNARGSSLTINPLWNPSGLVGYWPMDEGTGTATIDQSGNGNNGSWMGIQAGSSGYYSAGKVGPWAGSFDGSSTRALIANALSNYFYTTNAYTYSAWFNVKTFSPTYQTIIRKENGVGMGYYLTVSSGVVTLQSLGGMSASVNTAINAGSWYYLNITFNNGNVIFYLNGQAIGTGTWSGSSDTADPFEISDDYHPNTFNGLLDDVRVYNRVLSYSEIQAIYNAEK
jgi:prepilin-type N-terminal cleavage/methylation domain-containing protein